MAGGQAVIGVIAEAVAKTNAWVAEIGHGVRAGNGVGHKLRVEQGKRRGTARGRPRVEMKGVGITTVGPSIDVLGCWERGCAGTGVGSSMPRVWVWCCWWMARWGCSGVFVSTVLRRKWIAVCWHGCVEGMALVCVVYRGACRHRESVQPRGMGMRC